MTEYRVTAMGVPSIAAKEKITSSRVEGTELVCLLWDLNAEKFEVASVGKYAAKLPRRTWPR